MATVKISISLTDADVEFLDRMAATGAFGSRSAVIQHALARLQATDLQTDYAQAWNEWQESGDEDVWDSAAQVEGRR